MGFLYDVMFYASDFVILLIFSIPAIIFAKKLHSWIWYTIGAAITLLSLLGKQQFYESYYGSYYAEKMMAPYWTIYVVILGIVAFIIFTRYYISKAKELDTENVENVSEENIDNTKEDNSLNNENINTNTKKCKYCGKKVSSSIERCECGCLAFDEIVS